MNTELLDAVMAGDLTQVARVLKNGADVNAANEEGTTALMLAAGLGKLDLVEHLIKSGATVDATDARGWTALMKALFNYEMNRGFPDVVQALIDAGANIEHQITYGTRPLMLAAGYGEAGVVDVLLAAGADVNAKNEGGRTARVMAETKDYVEVINQLYVAELQTGADKEGKCPSGAGAAPKSNVITFMKNPLH